MNTNSRASLFILTLVKAFNPLQNYISTWTTKFCDLSELES